MSSRATPTTQKNSGRADNPHNPRDLCHASRRQPGRPQAAWTPPAASWGRFRPLKQRPSHPEPTLRCSAVRRPPLGGSTHVQITETLSDYHLTTGILHRGQAMSPPGPAAPVDPHESPSLPRSPTDRHATAALGPTAAARRALSRVPKCPVRRRATQTPPVSCPCPQTPLQRDQKRATLYQPMRNAARAGCFRSIGACTDGIAA